MKTYAEIRGYDPFDWNTFLMKGSYTDRELEDAHNDAKSWVTCACGNLCNDIPRYNNGQPVDDVLSTLGCEFVGVIFALKVAQGSRPLMSKAQEVARQILGKIEARSAFLLGEGTPAELAALFEMNEMCEEACEMR